MTSLPKCVTYLLPEGSTIRAVNLTRQGNAVVVTPYYPKGAIRFTRKGELPPWARLVHTEHKSHTAELHKSDNPFSWHAHIAVPAGKEFELLAAVLPRHSRQTKRTVARIRSRWGVPHRKEVSFKDGGRITYACNADESGLGLLADLDLKNAQNLSPAGMSRLISEAALRMRPSAADRIVELLLAHLPEAAVATWQNPADGVTLAHQAARAEAVGAIDALLDHKADVNAARKRDGNTVAHLAAYQHRESQTLKSALVLERILGCSPDLRAKNKYGETVGTIMGPPPGRGGD